MALAWRSKSPASWFKEPALAVPASILGNKYTQHMMGDGAEQGSIAGTRVGQSANAEAAKQAFYGGLLSGAQRLGVGTLLGGAALGAAMPKALSLGNALKIGAGFLNPTEFSGKLIGGTMQAAMGVDPSASAWGDWANSAIPSMAGLAFGPAGALVGGVLGGYAVDAIADATNTRYGEETRDTLEDAYGYFGGHRAAQALGASLAAGMGPSPTLDEAWGNAGKLSSMSIDEVAGLGLVSPSQLAAFQASYNPTANAYGTPYDLNVVAALKQQAAMDIRVSPMDATIKDIVHGNVNWSAPMSPNTTTINGRIQGTNLHDYSRNARALGLSQSAAYDHYARDVLGERDLGDSNNGGYNGGSGASIGGGPAIGDNASRDATGANRGNGEGDGAGGSGSTGGGGSVICAELVRRGEYDRKLYAAEWRFLKKHLTTTQLRGYHYWAVPLVKKMRAGSKLWNHIGKWMMYYADEIAYQAGAKPSGSWRGKAIKLVAEPLCGLIGRFVKYDKLNRRWDRKDSERLVKEGTK